MGASPLKIVLSLIPEAMPSLIMGSAIAITILGYSAMGGFVGRV